MAQIYLENWLKKTDIDYYTMFIFSWIPFNAWYMDKYYDYEQKIDSDREIIKKIKTEENPFRNKILNLISMNSAESIEFKKNLYLLHQQLEANTIPNQNNRVCFSSLRTHDNPIKQFVCDFRTKTLKFEFLFNQPRQTKRFRCEIIIRSTGNSVGLIELQTCTAEELQQNDEFLRQSYDLQKKILEGFNEINPNKPATIISNRRIGLKIHEELFFVNNKILISQFLVELLYQLRCKIFHGEIDPKPAYYDIYKYAYFLIKPLINTLN